MTKPRASNPVDVTVKPYLLRARPELLPNIPNAQANLCVASTFRTIYALPIRHTILPSGHDPQ